MQNPPLFFHMHDEILSTDVFQRGAQPKSDLLSINFQDYQLTFFHNDLAVIKYKKFLPKSST